MQCSTVTPKVDSHGFKSDSDLFPVELAGFTPATLKGPVCKIIKSSYLTARFLF